MFSRVAVMIDMHVKRILTMVGQLVNLIRSRKGFLLFNPPHSFQFLFGIIILIPSKITKIEVLALCIIYQLCKYEYLLVKIPYPY